MKREKKSLHFILGQELWKGGKIWTNKGNPLEPHLGCEKKRETKKALNYVIPQWRLVKVIKKYVILIVLRRGNLTTHYTLSHAKSCEKAKKVERIKTIDSSTALTLWKKKSKKNPKLC